MTHSCIYLLLIRHPNNRQAALQIDLLPSEEAVQAVESAILSHNSEVDIVRTDHCSVPISHILNKAAFAGSHRHPSQVLQLQPRQARIPVHSSSSMQHQSPLHTTEAPTARTQTQKASPSSSEAAQPGAGKGGGPHPPHDVQGGKATSQSEDQQHPAGPASDAAETDIHASHEGNGHQHHGHSHSQSGHLDSVTSISLVKQGQVDLAR